VHNRPKQIRKNGISTKYSVELGTFGRKENKNKKMKKIRNNKKKKKM
jgi:hypothetical protein